MNAREAQQKFNEELQQRLREGRFPDEDLPRGFDTYKHAALQFESVTSMERRGFNVQAWKVILMKRQQYSLFEIGNLIDIIQEKSPAQMHALIQPQGLDYYQMQNEVITMAKRWNEIVTPIRLSVEKKVEIMGNAGGQMNTKPIRRINGQ